MATPQISTTPFGLTGDLALDIMFNGYKWTLGSDRTIDWSISGGFATEFWTDPSGTAATIKAALDIVSYYANVKFNYVGSFDTPTAAANAGAEMDFSIDGANRFFTDTNQYARGFFPATLYEANYTGAAGDIYLNVKSPANNMSYEPGGVGWTVLLHEIGHTLGLKHPHNTGDGGQPTFNGSGLGDLDQDYMTVMSYSDDYAWNTLSWHPATPMLLDVLALQYLYGANTATNAGDTLFTIKEQQLYVTLWDPSGFDVLDFSTATQGWSIALPDLILASKLPEPVGVAMPTSETELSSPHSLVWMVGDYEQVIGSSYGDEIDADSYNNTVYAGGGNDVINDVGGSNYLRGEDGNDTITGGDGFDDINGNKGDDVAHGGLGQDWVVGGQDNDKLYGDEAFDVVYGNLGNDTVDGGAGADWVRGGQGADVVLGGDGNDWLWGDRGDDTITGGAGADDFHLQLGAALDRVTDFSVAEGDRVILDGKPNYTVSVSGSDTVIDLGGGDKMVLVGVQLSAGSWLVVS